MDRFHITLVLDKLIVLGGAEKVAEEIDTALNPTQIVATAVKENPSLSRFKSRLAVPFWARLIRTRTLFIIAYPIVCLLASMYKIKADNVLVYASSAARFFRFDGRAILYINWLPRGVHEPELFIRNRTLLRLANTVLPIFKKLEKAQYAKFEKIYCISEATQKSLLQEYNVPSDVVYCPVGTSWFETEAPLSLDSRDSFYLLVSRLEPSKALEPCLQFCHENEVPLLVVGEGALFEEFVGKFDRIKFLGHIGESELQHLVRTARAVFMPTPLEYSMTMLEAFSQGTPVIGIRCEATEELLERRESLLKTRLGVIYNTNAPADIAVALCALNRDYQLFSSISISESAVEFSPQTFHAHIQGMF